MGETKKIEIHHLTRVEGHGNIVAHIKDGRLEQTRFDIVEAPRFFEALLQGLNYDEVLHVAPRICGICSVAHKCAALKATEDAFGVSISDQTELLRRLALHGEVISSHMLHIYFLAGPDFLGLGSVFPLIASDRDLVLRAMRLKRLGYDICAVVAGRHTHPVGMRVGGFSFVHSETELQNMRRRLLDSIDEIHATADLLSKADIPVMERETEYVALSHPTIYPFYDGEVVSSLGGRMEGNRYREHLREYMVPNSTAKYAAWKGPEYMVGALARINTNYELLSPLAKEIAQNLGLKVPCHNPFMNTAAQLVECAHCVEDSVAIIDALCGDGIDADKELAQFTTDQGEGVGIVEAPRGALFHEYHYDRKGTCKWANHVIPTAQNLANLQQDMNQLVPLVADRDEDAIRQSLEMLVRAYDPCISCSTHVVRLEPRGAHGR